MASGKTVVFAVGIAISTRPERQFLRGPLLGYKHRFSDQSRLWFRLSVRLEAACENHHGRGQTRRYREALGETGPMDLETCERDSLSILLRPRLCGGPIPNQSRSKPGETKNVYVASTF